MFPVSPEHVKSLEGAVTAGRTASPQARKGTRSDYLTDPERSQEAPQ